MAVLRTCPSCGMESSEWRCPRCNALKVVGCAGSCTLCGSKSGCDVPPAERPEEHRDDPGDGTPPDSAR